MACHRSHCSTSYRFGTGIENTLHAMERTNTHVTYLSFRHSGIMAYTQNVDHRTRLLQSQAFINNAVQLQHRERYKGFVTPALKKRMQKAITILLQSTPVRYSTHPVSGRTVAHKLSFITLTTPTHQNSTSAKWCHKNLLEPTLRILRQRYGMKSYIWKVELQQNGQIHYHITTEIMINHTALRNIWNNLLRKHDMLHEFKKQYGHDNPNSTDIHAVHKVNNLEAYLVKYITKEYQNETKLDAKIWDCSKNIKTAQYFKTPLDFTTHQIIRGLQKTKEIITHYFEKAVYLDFKTTDYYVYFTDFVRDQFFQHLNDIQQWKTLLDTPRTLAQNITATVTETLQTKLQTRSAGSTKTTNYSKRQQLQLIYNCYSI